MKRIERLILQRPELLCDTCLVADRACTDE